MFPIHLYNTLHNRRELFVPQDEQRITMYVCGPTVYGPAHVGNARPAAVFDLFFRLLRLRYGKDAVIYARNITDIDDKIIAAAVEQNTTPEAIATRWREVYRDNLQSLHTLPPTMEPHATENITAMQKMIEILLEKKFAYEAEGHVLFSAESYANYGALSNRRAEDMIAGARVEVESYKKSPSDFVLWKPSSEDAPGWESPWGRGRPGWHIECSAMAASHLGTQIDIHGGGQDLIFPHHENEIAQSCAANSSEVFAHYWLHNGHINMDGEKMSKSLNNTRLLSDALSHYPGEAVRYALLSSHYRRPLNWNEELLTDSKLALDGLYRALEKSCATKVEVTAGDIAPQIIEALADDLNTPQAFAMLHEMAHKLNKEESVNKEMSRQFLSSANLLGILNTTPKEWFHGSKSGGLADAEIESLITERNTARANRDFAAADAARDKLLQEGVILEDSATGTSWRRV